jgi:hypothetical protein
MKVLNTGDLLDAIEDLSNDNKIPPLLRPRIHEAVAALVAAQYDLAELVQEACGIYHRGTSHDYAGGLYSDFLNPNGIECDEIADRDPGGEW